MAFFCFCLCFPLISKAGNIPDQRDSSANRIVSGIISFTRWPGKTSLPKLCIFPSAQHINFSTHPAINESEKLFDVIYITDRKILPDAHCDAIYFGRETPAQQSEVLLNTRNRPTLSISENNPDCTIGAAFCLLMNQSPPAFSVNLDSLSRSGVRVSPDVLLLSRKRY